MHVKFLCIHCGQKCKIDEGVIGYHIDCPACHQPLAVPAPPRLPTAEETAMPPQVEALRMKLRVPNATISNLKVSLKKAGTKPSPGPTIPYPIAPQPTLVSAAQPGKLYQCLNHGCGEVWEQSQLIEQPIGGKVVFFCPRCQLGVREYVDNRNFWGELSHAFAYPFRGPGPWILGTGTVLMAFLDAAQHVGGLLLALPRIFLLGFFGMLLLHIIRTTLFHEDEPVSWPEVHGYMDVVDTAKQLALSWFLIFLPAIVCFFMAGKSMFTGSADSFLSAGFWGIGAVALAVGGILYYPMGLLAVAMFDSFLAVNPVIVLPAIFRTLGPYLAILLVLGIMFAIRVALNMAVASVTLATKVILFLPVEFFSLYNLVLTARLLGLLCLTNRERLGWFKAREKR